MGKEDDNKTLTQFKKMVEETGLNQKVINAMKKQFDDKIVENFIKNFKKNKDKKDGFLVSPKGDDKSVPFPKNPPVDPNAPKSIPFPKIKLDPNPKFGKSLKKGGEVKGYMGGGSVNKNKSNMITKRGWGASRKT